VSKTKAARVPVSLFDSTLPAVELFAAGGTGPAVRSFALAQGVHRAMIATKLHVLVPLVLGVALAAGAGSLPYQVQAAGEEKPTVAAAPAAKGPRASKLDLTPQTFATFRDLVRPADNEWRHLKVKWLTDIVAARKKAAREDRPILIFRTGGAGYNDPMGVC
jgi:hypothetical protein